MDSVALGLGEVLRSTDKALLVNLVEEGKEVWIPISVIHDDSELYDDDDNSDGEVVVQQWWAEKNGLS
jgi:hypothetical protein